MESEGPYNPYKHQTEMWGTKECDKQCRACIYANGRKAAEKDFKELLEFADAMAYHRDDQSLLSRGFREWKKARGIE